MELLNALPERVVSDNLIGSVTVGIPRTSRALSYLHNGRIYYSIGRSILSVGVNSKNVSTDKNIEYITGLQSNITAISICSSCSVISAGSLTGEIIIMNLNGKILYRTSVGSTVYSIFYTGSKILVSVQYELLSIESDLKKEPVVLKRMNDIILYINSIRKENIEILVYSNSDTLFVNEQSVKYNSNVIFTRAVLMADKRVRIVVGLFNRKVYIYEYTDEKLVLKNLIHAPGLISDGVVLEDTILLVLSNSVNIYYCNHSVDSVGMIGPYDEEIIKVLVDRSVLAESSLNSLMDSLYIILSTAGVFKYTAQKAPLKRLTEIENNPKLNKVYTQLSNLSSLRNTSINIISGNTSEIKSMYVDKDCIVTTSGPTVRVFRVINEKLEEIFRPVIDGFTVNGAVSDWSGTFLTNSNNILKVYKPTQIYRIVQKDIIRRVDLLTDQYNNLVETMDSKNNELSDIVQNVNSLQEELEKISTENIPFTAVKQELSLTTIGANSLEQKEKEYIQSTIRCEIGLSSNHFLEVDKIYGFPFEISTFRKVNDNLLLLSCKSSQKEFSNLFILNAQLETVQKIFTHTKTITHILASDETVLTVGKDRRIAIYKVCTEMEKLPKEEITEYFTKESAGLNLLDTRSDHKKEILAGYISGTVVITASRDKTVCTYGIVNSNLSLEHTERVETPITAITLLKEHRPIENIDSDRIIFGDNNGNLLIDKNKYKLHNSAITHIEPYTNTSGFIYLITASSEGILKLSKLEEFGL